MSAGLIASYFKDHCSLSHALIFFDSTFQILNWIWSNREYNSLYYGCCVSKPISRKRQTFSRSTSLMLKYWYQNSMYGAIRSVTHCTQKTMFVFGTNIYTEHYVFNRMQCTRFRWKLIRLQKCQQIADYWMANRKSSWNSIRTVILHHLFDPNIKQTA